MLPQGICRLKEHKADVTNVDLLIEPHHARKFGRSYDFLDTLKPKVTIFDNVNSEHLAYGAWNSGNFPYIAYSSPVFGRG